MAPKITVHWLNHSRAQRILWLLEELELPYDVKKYDRTKDLLAPPELKSVHSLGKSPVVTIEDDGEVSTLVESGSIVEFLIERFGEGKLQVAPSASVQERSSYLFWLHWAEGSAMTPLVLGMVFNQMPKKSPWSVRPLISAVSSRVIEGYIQPDVKKNFDFVESELSVNVFFVADKLTGADIMMSYIAETLEIAPGLNNYPNIKSWHSRMQQRPAYKKALDRGGVTDMKVFL